MVNVCKECTSHSAQIFYPKDLNNKEIGGVFSHAQKHIMNG